MKRAKVYFANLKISSKIWFCMLGIGVILSLFIGILSSWYFARLYREDTYNQTADSLQIGSQALNDSYHTLLTSVVDFASTQTFFSIVQDAQAGNLQYYSRHTASIQENLESIVRSNPILDSMMIIGKNGEFFSLFTNALSKDADPSSFFGWDISYVDGITWLPTCKSPFIKGNQVVPVIIPIGNITNHQYLRIATDYETAHIFIILLLSNKSISQRLALANSSYADRILYITDRYGNNLNLTPDSACYDIAASPNISHLIWQNYEVSSINHNESAIQLLLDEHNYSLYGTDLGYCGLKMLCIHSKTQLYQRITMMNTFISFIALVGLLITTLLAFHLSHFVTRPFKQLIANVKNIENNTYDTPYQMKYQDEIGHLNQAINSMYQTIQMQFQQIRQSERAKYHSEIQLLSEQINPHFLYNTLECINMEVLGGHKKEASSMITSLGDFLRIGLSYGNEVIPIGKELTHVKAYIDIMNHRFNRKIDLKLQLEPELHHIYILKSILQPLAENAIRHGFDADDVPYENILMPIIEIHIFAQTNKLVLEVRDNGRGIDIAKATAALNQEHKINDAHGHVGLNNIYQRLQAYYGDVSVDFETIPYYRNTVRITVPR